MPAVKIIIEKDGTLHIEGEGFTGGKCEMPITSVIEALMAKGVVGEQTTRRKWEYGEEEASGLKLG